MSYDLHIRSDAQYSAWASTSDAIEFIKQLPNIEWNGKWQLILNDEPSRHMEINLETYHPHLGYSDSPGAEFNLISLHIPYAYFDADSAEQNYAPTAIAIAKFLGWKLHNKQTGLDDDIN